MRVNEDPPAPVVNELMVEARRLRDAGDHRAAARCLSRILDSVPHHVQALNLFGQVQFRSGKLREALQLFNRSLEIEPNQGGVLVKKARILMRLGRHGQAGAALHEAVAVDPSNATIHNLLGLFLQRKGELQRALDCFDAAIRLEPSNAKALVNRGRLLNRMGLIDEAIRDFDKVVLMQPENPDRLRRYSITLRKLNRPEAAISVLQRAIELDPDHFKSLSEYGRTLIEAGRNREAIKVLDAALSRRPGDNGVLWNRAIALLPEGMSEVTLRLFEHRLRCKRYGMCDHPLPLLGAEDATDREILVQWEMRYGDVIQMLRYVPIMEQMAKRCGWEIKRPLRALFSRSFPNSTMETGDNAATRYAFRVPYSSLPLAARTFVDSAIPSSLPYLYADQNRVRQVRARLPSPSGRVIGIAWRGKPVPPGRSLPLQTLRPLFQDGKNFFVVVQKEVNNSEREMLAQFDNVLDASERIDTFDDTAAFISATDLVISNDSAVAHLAGALGTPLWLLAKFAADWRWCQGGDNNPWYPGIRIFRQETPRDWGGVISSVIESLGAMTTK